MACMFYFARCINILFNSLLAVYTTRKIKFIHAICYYILLLSFPKKITHHLSFCCQSYSTKALHLWPT